MLHSVDVICILIIIITSSSSSTTTIIIIIISIIITQPADALQQLDAVSCDAAVAAATSDAVLYNSALALMQGGGQGFMSAFTVLARCSHLQVSSVVSRAAPPCQSHVTPGAALLVLLLAARVRVLRPRLQVFQPLVPALPPHSSSQRAPARAAEQRVRCSLR